MSKKLAYYDLMKTYAPDCVLASLGFSYHLTIQDIFLSLPQTFGLSLVNAIVCPQFTSQVTEVKASLKDFQRKYPKFRAVCGEIEQFLWRIFDEGIGDEITNIDLFLTKLEAFQTFWQELDLERIEETVAIKTFSSIFKVHIVFFIHMSATVDCYFGLCEGRAPVVYLEKIQNTNSVLVLNPEGGHEVLLTDAEIRSKYQHYVPQPVDNLGYPKPELARLMSLHQSLLRVLVPLLPKPIPQSAVPNLSAVLQEAMALTLQLNLDSTVLSELQSLLRNRR